MNMPPICYGMSIGVVIAELSRLYADSKKAGAVIAAPCPSIADFALRPREG